MAIDPPHPRAPSPSTIEHLRQPSAVPTLHACSCGYLVGRLPDGTQRLWPSGLDHLRHLARPEPASPTGVFDRYARQQSRWFAEMDRRGGIYAGKGDEDTTEADATSSRAARHAEKQADPRPPTPDPPETAHSAPTAGKPAEKKTHRRSLRG